MDQKIKCGVEEIQHKAKKTSKRLQNENRWHESTERSQKIEVRIDIGWVFRWMKFSLSQSLVYMLSREHSLRKFKYQLDGKNLKYGENEKNHIFTIDNTNALKKKRSQFDRLEKTWQFY